MPMSYILIPAAAAAVAAGAVLVHRNSAKLKEREKAALTDVLTGGMSETAFISVADALLSGGGESFAMVSMQITNMKLIYGSFGAGESGNTMCRVYDVICSQLGGEEPAARTGEDTFCFMLKNRKTEEISARLNRICDLANQTGAANTDTYRLQAEFGIYLPENNGESAGAALGKAVLARQSGQKGRRCHFYDRGLWEKSGWEREAACSIESALQINEFVVYYQPKVRILDQRIVGAEALIRWRHPQRGLLSPDMFLPLVEQYQKIGLIDRFVFGEVCRTLARWKKQGRETCPISVNLSRADLECPTYAQECSEICSRFGADPANIEFELKEELLLEDPQRAKVLIDDLHGYGFRCAVDNFGARVSSLQMLGTLAVDAVKLDGSFFGGDNDTQRGRYIVEAILKLASQLHIHTVAEGIDSPGQIKYLQQVGCDAIQGFYYYKPMPLEKFESEAYERENLRYANKNAMEDAESAARRHVALSHAMETAKSIIQFSYLLEEDSVEFSEVFSPVLGSSRKLAKAMYFFRTTELIHENDREDFFRLLERCQREGGWVQNTLRFYLTEGRYGWLEVHLHREGNVISGTMINLAEWKNEVNRWKEKATRDALTGLYNREYFVQNVRSRLEQQAYSSAAVLFIDVDDFKTVNDTYGHKFGDDVLCYVAKQVLGIFRHTDIVARFGGDEFVVFAPSIQRPILEDRLKRLCSAFSYPCRSNSQECKVSVTIGAAMYPEDGVDYEQLLEHADCALYEAKNRGKDQFVLYEPYMQGENASASASN